MVKEISIPLPSKKLLKVLVIPAGVVLLILILTSVFGSKGLFNQKKGAISARGTVGDVVLRDSNKNGIADWEESLWGLDPSGNGEENKRLILEKKKASGLTVGSSGTTGSEELTTTDKMTREMMSTIIALYQAGSLTPEALENIGLSFKDTIDSHRTVEPRYKISDITIATGDQKKAAAAYQLAIGALVSKYADAGMGDEFDVLAENLSEGGSGDLSILATSGNSYTALAEEIVTLNTPRGAAYYALNLANACALAGQALPKVSRFYNDVTVGIAGLDEYTSASLAFDRAIDSLVAYFENTE